MSCLFVTIHFGTMLPLKHRSLVGRLGAIYPVAAAPVVLSLDLLLQAKWCRRHSGEMQYHSLLRRQPDGH